LNGVETGAAVEFSRDVRGRRAGSRWAVFALALVVRAALFPFADNKQADAPIRALLAERMNSDPGAAGDPRSFRQFGPLPIEVMRPFLAVDPDARRASRLPSLLAGLAVFWPFFSLARRMGATGGALSLAGLALALAPLHIQVSITAASEALYLLCFVATLDRLHAAMSERRRRDFALAGLWGGLAAVTRYDMWLSLPAAGAMALWLGARDRRGLFDVALFLGIAAILPGAYLLWSGLSTGDPLFFAHFIAQDHVGLAAAASQRLGPVLARLRQPVIWSLSFAAAMTPVPFLALWGAIPRASRTRYRLDGPTWVVLSAALAPIGVYLIKGIGLGQFEPLPRFAIAPGAILLPVAATLLQRAWGRRPPAQLSALVVGGMVVLVGLLEIASHGRPGRAWEGPESLSPLTRMEPDDRALAAYLEQHRQTEEGVFIDPLGFTDIVIVHAARIPAARAATLAQTRSPSPTLAETRARTQSSWFAAHDLSWGKTTIADWPADGLRFGGWRLAHYGGAAPTPR